MKSPLAFRPRFIKLPDDTPMNRLALAQWLMSPENTLTPRVWANRIWARLFGIGIVETEEDFGALGALPTHPELLDWLAAEYRDNGWSLKKLLKTIVMSRTYRQSSAVTAELRDGRSSQRVAFAWSEVSTVGRNCARRITGGVWSAFGENGRTARDAASARRHVAIDLQRSEVGQRGR